MAFDMSMLPPIDPNLTPEQLRAVHQARAQLLSMAAATGQQPPAVGPGTPLAPAPASEPPPSLGRIILNMLHPPPGGPTTAATPPIVPNAAPAQPPVNPASYFPVNLDPSILTQPRNPMPGTPVPSTSIGESLTPAQAPVNPFISQEGQELPLPERTPPTNEGQPVVKIQPEVIQERKKGWKAFIERFKTDPNLRLSLFQASLALTQPAGSAAEGIGNALKTGIGTMDALQQREREQAKEDRAEGREERQVATQEGSLEQRSKEFAAETEQARKDYELRLKQLESNEAYQRELLRIRNIEATGGGSEGQVNARWSRLRDAMLADPTPELASITDPQARRNRAELIAFELINKSGQTRERFIADYLADQQLFLPDPQKDSQGYATGMQQLVQRAHSLADTAGLSQTRAAPQGPPSTASAPVSTPTPTSSTPSQPQGIQPGEVTATGPGGQKLVLRNGQWIPVR